MDPRLGGRGGGRRDRRPRCRAGRADRRIGRRVRQPRSGTADDLRSIRIPLHQTRSGAHRMDAGDGPGEAGVDQDGRLPPVQSGPTGYPEHSRLDRAPRHRQRKPAGAVRSDPPHRAPHRCRVGARLGHPRHPDGVDPRGHRLRRAGGHPGSRHQSRPADRTGRGVRRQPRRRQIAGVAAADRRPHRHRDRRCRRSRSARRRVRHRVHGDDRGHRRPPCPT